MKNKTYNKKKMLIVFLCALIVILGLTGRLVYLMVFDAEYYQEKAKSLHEREREIKAARGEIIDRNGTVLATNKTVCTISVIHSQIKEPERVIKELSSILGLEEETVRKRVEKVSSMERIKTNVEKEVGDKIRNLELDGVKVDEDFKRYYPFEELASKVLGFTGGDNQGIIGLEVGYENELKGQNGMILTTTDARGIELDGVAEDRIEPRAGNTLQISLDYNIQMYAQQMAEKVMEEKQAEKEIRYDYFNLDDKSIFRDHEPLIAPAPKCEDGDHFYYKEKKLSFTKVEDVYKRALQTAKKGRVFTFHWRGGYLTRAVLEELLDQIQKAGK